MSNHNTKSGLNVGLARFGDFGLPPQKSKPWQYSMSADLWICGPKPWPKKIKPAFEDRSAKWMETERTTTHWRIYSDTLHEHQYPKIPKPHNRLHREIVSWTQKHRLRKVITEYKPHWQPQLSQSTQNEIPKSFRIPYGWRCSQLLLLTTKKGLSSTLVLHLEKVTANSIDELLHAVLGTDVLGHGLLLKEKNCRFNMVTNVVSSTEQAYALKNRPSDFFP